MNDFFERIKALSLKNNTTFAEIERKIGISNGTIARWNKSIPRVDMVLKVANFFNVSLDFLITGKEFTNTYSNISNSSIVQNNNATTLIVRNGETTTRELTEQEIELLKIYNSFDLRQQTNFLAKIFEFEKELK